MSVQRSLPVYYLAYAITGLAFPAATMPSGKVVSATISFPIGDTAGHWLMDLYQQ